jgi:hypothetical protein
MRDGCIYGARMRNSLEYCCKTTVNIGSLGKAIKRYGDACDLWTRRTRKIAASSELLHYQEWLPPRNILCVPGLGLVHRQNNQVGRDGEVK